MGKMIDAWELGVHYSYSPSAVKMTMNARCGLVPYYESYGFYG